MAQERGRRLPPLPKLSSPSESARAGKSSRSAGMPSPPPQVGAKASKKVPPTLAQLDLGPQLAPVPVSSEIAAKRPASDSHSVVGTDDEFLDIVTSSHPALEVDPKLLEEADDDFDDGEAAPLDELDPLGPAADLAEDFFAVTDDDEEGTTAVDTPAAEGTSDAANGAPTVVGADSMAPPVGAGPGPAPARDASTDSVPDLAAPVRRAQLELGTLNEQTEAAPLPRRRPAAAFAVGLGIGIAAGVAAAIVLVSPLGAGHDGDGSDIAAASIAGMPAASINCPNEEAAAGGDTAARSTPMAETEDPPGPSGSAMAPSPDPETGPLEPEALEQQPLDATAAAADPQGMTGSVTTTAAQAAIAAVEDEDTAVAQARAALVRGQPKRALELASAVDEAKSSNAAIEVMTVAQCQLGEGPAARQLFRKLVFKEPRRRVADRCLELEIQIFAETLSRTPKEMLAAAGRHYGKGEREHAERLALESFKARRRPEALALVGMIACDAHDADKAARYAKRIDGETHDNLLAHCADKGIELPDK